MPRFALLTSDMTYEYDVFLSYPTEHPFGTWTTEVFLPLFESYLANALGVKTARIFHDKRGIHGGESWNERLNRALATSKCMIGIWTPSYFGSPYCRAECAAFLYRERRHGYRTIKNPGGLIVPVTALDGESFPAMVKHIQCLDCNRYARVGYGFTKTERYVEFQDRLSDWVFDDVAKAVHYAPPFSKAWLSQQWLDKSLASVNLEVVAVFRPPSLR